jgi:GABA permease
MSWTTKLLVIANRTADSDALHDMLVARAAAGPVEVTLVAPASAPGTKARVERALGRLHEAGLTAEGTVGDPDPIVAVQDAWDPRRFDEVVVATLPTDVSQWLSLDLPRRIARLTDARVTHVTASVPVYR